MDPSGQVAAVLQPQSRKIWLKFALFVLIGSVLIIGITLIVKQIQSQKTPSSTARTLTQKELMNNDIRVVFDARQNPEIIKLANQAFIERDPSKEYQDYVVVFEEMKRIYSQTQDPKVSQLMYELKNFTIANPIYKEEDWIIPN